MTTDDTGGEASRSGITSLDWASIYRLRVGGATLPVNGKRATSVLQRALIILVFLYKC